MNVRGLAGIALAVVLFGYAVVVRPFESRLSTGYARLAAARGRIAAQAALGPRLDAADHERRRLRARLARYGLAAPGPELVARFLRAANAAAVLHGTEIRGLDAEPATPPHGTTPLFDELPLRLTVRGSYAALLATVRDLAAAPVAVRLAFDALAPTERAPTGTPLLDAGISVVLLHLAAPTPAANDVRTRPH